MINLPNILTIARILMTFGFIFFLMKSYPDAIGKAFWIFMIASVTDFLDGFIARRWNLITNFGKIADPLADKFLTLSAFIVLAFKGCFLWWCVILITVREVLITLYRFWAMSQNKVLAAEKMGKAKTVVQMLTIAMGILYAYVSSDPQLVVQMSDKIFSFLQATQIMLYCSTVLTIASGIQVLLPKKGK